MAHFFNLYMQVDKSHAEFVQVEEIIAFVVEGVTMIWSGQPAHSPSHFRSSSYIASSLESEHNGAHDGPPAEPRLHLHMLAAHSFNKPDAFSFGADVHLMGMSRGDLDPSHESRSAIDNSLDFRSLPEDDVEVRRASHLEEDYGMRDGGLTYHDVHGSKEAGMDMCYASPDPSLDQWTDGQYASPGVEKVRA